MIKQFSILFFCLNLLACHRSGPPVVQPPVTQPVFVSAADISRFPEIELKNPVFYNSKNQKEDFLNILKSNSIITIRLRLWVDPINVHSGFDEVSGFSKRLKSLGFKIWLTLHYSDTWADPGNQQTPKKWQNISFSDLKDSVQVYTQKVVKNINPEYIQIGNEINSGFLHPEGHLANQPEQFNTLMTVAIQTVRDHATDAKIIIHYAGLNGSDWFFNQMTVLNYDIISLSYYLKCHAKDLNTLKNTLQGLSQTYQKDIFISETAYPFTLDWNDWTNNIIGLDNQLILPQYPASTCGQTKFTSDVKNIINKDVTKGISLCYWGAELIAWKGKEVTDASAWENQAFFDFENKALPVLEVFKTE